MNHKLKTKFNQKHMHHLHKKLVSKNGWYAFWHVQIYHQHIQWTILALVVVMVGVITVAQIKPGWLDSSNRSKATSSAPQLPLVYINSAISATPVTGKTISVPAGGDFQAALNSALPGDEIVLAAGATYPAPNGGGFILPNKSGSGWITIRSSNMSGLPAEGTRVTPAQAGAMPKIVAAATEPALSTPYLAPITGSTVPANSHNYRFVGIEFTVPATQYLNYGIIVVGRSRNQYASSGALVPDQVALNQLPHDIIFDRVYIHGNATGDVARGIALNGGATAVVDSYISGIRGVGFDTQAIAGWNGSGPFKIVNNYLEAAGENVLFGGSDSASAQLMPSDIEVRHNYFFKPLSWKVGDPSYAGTHWSIKNLFELKSSRRVLIDGNIFEHSWADGQQGWCLVLTPRNQEGTAPWGAVEDTTYTHNLCRDTEQTLDLLGHDDQQPSQQLNRVLIANNVFEQDKAGWAIILRDTANLSLDHNTVFQSGNLGTVDLGPITALNTGFSFTNNITMPHDYGFFGSGVGEGNPALTTYFINPVFARNVLTGRSSSVYPANNFFPATVADIGFVNYNNGVGGDYHLISSSPYKNAGTDGKDIGADIDALNAALSGVVQGTASGSYTPPPSTSPKSHLNLNPASVSFSAVVGDPAPSPKTVTLSNSGSASSSWASSSASDWCHVTPLSGSLASGGSANLSVSVDAADAAHIGTFPCTISIIDANADNSPQSINISYTVTASSTSDTQSPVVVLTAPANGATVSGTVAMSATATDNVIVDIVYFFIDDAYAGSDTTAPYTFSWNSTLVANGTHKVVAYGWDKSGNRGDSAFATITVSNGGTSSKSHLSLSSTSVSFSAVSGDPAPAAKIVNMANTGTASSSWVSSASQNWCHLTPASGSLAPSGSVSLSVSVDAPSNVGTFSCNISLVDANADNSPQSINISYTVTAAPDPTGTVTPSITSYSVTSKNATSATITWVTSQPTVGVVNYGSVKTNLNLSATDGVSQVTHTVTLTNLTSKSAYYYQITASNANGSATTSTSSFRTKPR